ncbi:MAG: hypothetical protein ACK5KR_01680 [Breznakia sp.]
MKLEQQIKISFYIVGLLLIFSSKLFAVMDTNIAMSIAAGCLVLSFCIDAFMCYKEKRFMQMFAYILVSIFFVSGVLYIWKFVL